MQYRIEKSLTGDVGDLYFSSKAGPRFIPTDETFEMAEKFDIS